MGFNSAFKGLKLF